MTPHSDADVRHDASQLQRATPPKLYKVQRQNPRAIDPYGFVWGVALLLSVCFAVLLLSGCSADLGFSPRPQDPKERPYKIESVQFAGGPGVTLSGELTMPDTNGPHKAVVLISGSGPQDRDEALAGHRPFLVLSDHLTRAGYAVLRYDDRGFAQSTGSYGDASMRDFAEDAAGAFRYLEKRQEVNAKDIGFLGSSEGGYIAPAAAKLVDPAFMIFLAGPVRPFFDVLATQAVDIMRAEGKSEAEIKILVTQYDRANAILSKPAPLPQVRKELDTYLASQGLKLRDREDLLDTFATPWGVGYATYDPITALRALPNPVLALFGDKDLQVSAKEEAPVMRAALRHPLSNVQVFAGLNHLFQPAETGHPSEYEEIETTMSPQVLNRISEWLGSL